MVDVILPLYLYIAGLIFGIWLGTVWPESEFQNFTKMGQAVAVIFLFLCSYFWPITFIVGIVYAIKERISK